MAAEDIEVTSSPLVVTTKVNTVGEGETVRIAVRLGCPDVTRTGEYVLVASPEATTLPWGAVIDALKV